MSANRIVTFTTENENVTKRIQSSPSRTINLIPLGIILNFSFTVSERCSRRLQNFAQILHCLFRLRFDPTSDQFHLFGRQSQLSANVQRFVDENRLTVEIFIEYTFRINLPNVELESAHLPVWPNGGWGVR